MKIATGKITRAATRIKLGLQDALYLGNLDAKRDWGYAPDFVRAMHLMLNHTEPLDFVVASGELHTVGDFCEAAFMELRLDWRDYVRSVEKFYRREDDVPLHGEPSKI